jgi:hypothetical protein
VPLLRRLPLGGAFEVMKLLERDFGLA